MIKKLGPAEDGRMWRKETRQRSFAEQSIVGGNGCNARLRGIAELLDWGALERELTAVYAAGEGRPAYRPLVMFKALLLQQWYQLSDPGLEEALVDRLSFRRFIGLGLEEAVPDHSTLSRFRSQLAARGLGERLLEALNRQLEQRGLMLKRGTLLDATVVAAVRKAVLTGAKTNESTVAEQLIGGDEACVYADKAYDSAARRQRLERLGIADGIMRRAWWGTAHHPDPQLVARNRALAGVRFAVERSFATMKRWYGYRRVRYRGLVRNALQLYLLCSAINLRRALVLRAA
jgi:transposase, IS5 family